MSVLCSSREAFLGVRKGSMTDIHCKQSPKGCYLVVVNSRAFYDEVYEILAP